MCIYCFSNVQVSPLIPTFESKKPKTSNVDSHQLCYKDKCLAAAKRIKSIEDKILNIPDQKEGKVVENKNSENKETSTQTLLKAMDCTIICPVLKTVGVKTDYFKLSLNSYESESSSSKSSGSVVRRSNEIVKRICMTSDTEDDVDSDRTAGLRLSKDDKNSKSGTIKSVFRLEGPAIECNVSQYVHSCPKD